jgi:hypothetical protein
MAPHPARPILNGQLQGTARFLEDILIGSTFFETGIDLDGFLQRAGQIGWLRKESTIQVVMRVDEERRSQHATCIHNLAICQIQPRSDVSNFAESNGDIYWGG